MVVTVQYRVKKVYILWNQYLSSPDWFQFVFCLPLECIYGLTMSQMVPELHLSSEMGWFCCQKVKKYLKTRFWESKSRSKMYKKYQIFVKKSEIFIFLNIVLKWSQDIHRAQKRSKRSGNNDSEPHNPPTSIPWPPNRSKNMIEFSIFSKSFIFLDLWTSSWWNGCRWVVRLRIVISGPFQAFMRSMDILGSL